MPVLEDLIPYLWWGAVVLLSFSAVSAGVAGLCFRRARFAQYYIMRESARKQGLWWLVVGLGTLVLSLPLFYLSGHLPSPFTPSPTPSSTPTVIATLAETPTSAATATPMVSPSATPTRRPTATPPFIPTPTPAYPRPETALTPQPGAAPAGPDAQITFLTLALGEENGHPVEPGSEFPPGDHRVYLFFEYRGMERNVLWTYGWYREEEYLDGDTRLWTLGGAGTTYLYFKPPGGYEPGIYDIRVWIEDSFQGVAQFHITEE